MVVGEGNLVGVETFEGVGDGTFCAAYGRHVSITLIWILLLLMVCCGSSVCIQHFFVVLCEWFHHWVACLLITVCIDIVAFTKIRNYGLWQFFILRFVLIFYFRFANWLVLVGKRLTIFVSHIALWYMFQSYGRYLTQAGDTAFRGRVLQVDPFHGSRYGHWKSLFSCMTLLSIFHILHTEFPRDDGLTCMVACSRSSRISWRA